MTSVALAVVFAIRMATGIDTGLNPELNEAALAREARSIEAMLMAPCCYAQQVSVHQSDAAAQVRIDVRERLRRGETRAQILDAFVARYGKRILAEPPAAGFDLSLYVLPIVAFGLSLGLVAVVLRRFLRHPQVGKAGAAGAAGIAGADTIDDIPSPLQRQLDDELRDLD